jgi:hypothetical protein
MQSRVFDFSYPNAKTVLSASPFELQALKSMNFAEFECQRPTWFNTSRRIIGNLPAERDQIAVMFQGPRLSGRT